MFPRGYRDAYEALRRTVRSQAATLAQVEKVIAMACGSLITFDDNTEMSPELALQHAIVLTLRDLVAGLRPGRTAAQVPLLLQVS